MPKRAWLEFAFLADPLTTILERDIVRRSVRKPKGEGHSRRSEILKAAERLFVEQGYDGATIRKIADEVGLSSTALYMHFSEKREILHEICRQSFETLIAANTAILATSGSPREQLRAMLQAYVDFGYDNPNAYRLIYLTRPSEAREGAESAAQGLGSELFGSLGNAVDRLASSDGICTKRSVAAQIVWAGVHGIVSLTITKPYFDWADRQVLTDTMIDILINGLLKP